jgi:hypothetical protein
MVDGKGGWARQSEAFWRAHHEAWKRSDFRLRQPGQTSQGERRTFHGEAAMSPSIIRAQATSGTKWGDQEKAVFDRLFLAEDRTWLLGRWRCRR